MHGVEQLSQWMMDGGKANCLIVDVRGHQWAKEEGWNDPSDNGLGVGRLQYELMLSLM